MENKELIFNKDGQKGKASILINYNKGKISVFHGTDKTLLTSWKEGKEENQWSIIWDLINSLKLKH